MKKGKNLDLISIYQKETKQIDSTTFIIYVLMDLATSDWEKEIERRRKNNLHYEEKELTHILNKLTNTFAELQKINISHRDIKPQNILYFKESNKYKLSDFGEAKELKQNNENNNISNYSKQTLRGTQLFMSPILFDALKLRKKNILDLSNIIFLKVMFIVLV
jgi:serine/threonine protein kinase